MPMLSQTPLSSFGIPQIISRFFCLKLSPTLFVDLEVLCRNTLFDFPPKKLIPSKLPPHFYREFNMKLPLPVIFYLPNSPPRFLNRLLHEISPRLLSRIWFETLPSLFIIPQVMSRCSNILYESPPSNLGHQNCPSFFLPQIISLQEYLKFSPFLYTSNNISSGNPPILYVK